MSKVAQLLLTVRCAILRKVVFWADIVELENTNTNRDNSLGCDYPGH